VREPTRQRDLKARFSVVVMCEVIEHVFDDRRLLRAAAGCSSSAGACC
jgi:2-polyprenyl-3-methyl-5-hydroxy-6-metoxy-1,4-benzoquinol methylase